MPLYLFTQAELEAEVSSEVVRQVFDDDNNGAADPLAVDRQREASATYILSGLRRVYPTLVTNVTAWQSDLSLVPPKLKQMALDHTVACMAKRHATYVRRDWKKLLDYVDDQIGRIRKTGLDSLGIDEAPEPATNQGGSIIAPGGLVGEAPPSFFNGCGGLGDF